MGMVGRTVSNPNPYSLEEHEQNACGHREIDELAAHAIPARRCLVLHWTMLGLNFVTNLLLMSDMTVSQVYQGVSWLGEAGPREGLLDAPEDQWHTGVDSKIAFIEHP